MFIYRWQNDGVSKYTVTTADWGKPRGLGDVIAVQARRLSDVERPGFLNPEHEILNRKALLAGELCSGQLPLAGSWVVSTRVRSSLLVGSWHPTTGTCQTRPTSWHLTPTSCRIQFTTWTVTPTSCQTKPEPLVNSWYKFDVRSCPPVDGRY
jgi:hypothetical protein